MAKRDWERQKADVDRAAKDREAETQAKQYKAQQAQQAKQERRNGFLQKLDGLEKEIISGLKFDVPLNEHIKYGEMTESQIAPMLVETLATFFLDHDTEKDQIIQDALRLADGSAESILLDSKRMDLHSRTKEHYEAAHKIVNGLFKELTDLRQRAANGNGQPRLPQNVIVNNQPLPVNTNLADTAIPGNPVDNIWKRELQQ